MRQGSGRFGAGRIIMACAVLAVLGGCTRTYFGTTECIGGRPAVERTNDVAPPNC